MKISKDHLSENWLMIVIIALVIIIAFFAALWTANHRAHVKALRLSQQALVEYNQLLQSTTPLSFDKLLTALNSNYQAKQALEGDHLNFVIFRIPYDNNLRQEMKTMQQIYLQRLFIPLLSNLYQRAIAARIKQPRLIYPFLKAYIMLGKPKKTKPGLPGHSNPSVSS